MTASAPAFKRGDYVKVPDCDAVCIVRDATAEGLRVRQVVVGGGAEPPPTKLVPLEGVQRAEEAPRVLPTASPQLKAYLLAAGAVMYTPRADK